MTSPDGDRPRIAVLGGGSAAESLTRSVADAADVIVFEPALVGGECPFLACMPSKSMLHDARDGADWNDAVDRRRSITDDLDDHDHAADLEAMGVELVREAARIVDPHSVAAGRTRHDVDHIVLATGSEPLLPDVDGLDSCRDRVWTSADVYRSTERPERVAVIGAGVIGFEVADLYAGFGTAVTVIDRGERSFDTIPPEVARVVVDAVTSRSVDVRYDVEAAAIAPVDRSPDGAVALTLSDGEVIEIDRVVVAIGRRPRTDGIGLDTVGLDPSEPLPLDPNGRVRCEGSVWATGDVAGRGQYTHLANHHAAVVADHLVGTGTRTFDEVVLGSCMFTAPPLIQVGPQWSELVDDPDVVSVGYDLESFPRAATDRLGAGHLWVAARRSTGTVVAASGAGPRFDELVHALVIAVDGRVPVARLRRSMQPFPTIGEILGPIWADLHDDLTSAA